MRARSVMVFGILGHMHWFDVIAVLLLAALAIRGYSRGLIIQLSALVAVALGLLGGLYLHSVAAAIIPDFGQPVLRLVAGFTVVFVAVALCVNLLARALKSMVDALFLGIVDRGLGAVLGVSTGVLLLMLFVVLVGRYLPEGMQWLGETRTAPLLSGLIEVVLPLLPDHFVEFFEAHADTPGELFRRFEGLRREGTDLLDAAGSIDAL